MPDSDAEECLLSESKDCFFHERRRREDKISEEAAHVAVYKVFFALGVDVNDPKSMEDFREDLRFGKKLRRLADKGVMFTFSIVAASVVLASWDSLTDLVKNTVAK